jgi:hypothetical protein
VTGAIDVRGIAVPENIEAIDDQTYDDEIVEQEETIDAE